MRIPVVRWSWMVGEEGSIFWQRGWCTLDETFVNSKGMMLITDLSKKWDRIGAKNSGFSNFSRLGNLSSLISFFCPLTLPAMRDAL
jgi:hypothetical protein